MLPLKTLKHINKLQQKKYRREFGEFFVEGIKNVREAFVSDVEIILVLMDGAKRDEPSMLDIAELANTKQTQLEYIGRQDIGSLKTTDTFPGIMAVIARPDVAIEDIQNNKPIIALDGIKDPGNLGTIIRTADWFGIQNILLSEDCVDQYSPKVARSTMGSLFHVSVFESQHMESALKTLKETYTIAALDTNGAPMTDMHPDNKTVYLFGSESHGIRSELEPYIDKRYTISGTGRAESLNVAVAAGIVMGRVVSGS